MIHNKIYRISPSCARPSILQNRGLKHNFIFRESYGLVSDYCWNSLQIDSIYIPGCPESSSLTVQNPGLKHHSFHSVLIAVIFYDIYVFLNEPNGQVILVLSEPQLYSCMCPIILVGKKLLFNIFVPVWIYYKRLVPCINLRKDSLPLLIFIHNCLPS